MLKLLKGRRTYISLALMVIVALTNYLTGNEVFSQEVQAALITLLGAAAAYFRSLA